MRPVTRQLRLAGGLAALTLAGSVTALIMAEAADPAVAARQADRWMSTVILLLRLLGAWSFVVAGLVAAVRRPDNRTGLLMVLVGLTFLATGLAGTDHPSIGEIVRWIQPMHLAILIHALLAFPTGRLESGESRWVAIGGYGFWLVFHVGLYFEDQPAGVILARVVSPLLAVVVTATASAILVRRWLVGSRAWRRTVSLVLWPGVAFLVALGLYNLAQVVSLPLELEVAQWVFRVAFVVMPFTFLAALLRSHLARGSVAGLVVELDEAREPGALRDALASALGDPSLWIAYWLPDEGRYVDIAGRSVRLPGEGDPTTGSLVDRDGRHVAAIVHDRAVADEPELVRAASAAAALALENERLQAELRARLDELSGSRLRIVQAADAERRRIERNLHDGTQQRLTSISIALGLAESKLESDPASAHQSIQLARTALGTALAELRDLSQGIHPGVLTERGLQPALEDLAYAGAIPISVRADVGGRLPENVEAAAYYVVAEALANVAKHSHASRASVEASREQDRIVLTVVDDGIGGADESGGTGLRGLADRLHALGGSLAIESPPGGGTCVRVVIPCA